MFSHSKLVLFLLVIILIVMICICHSNKNKKLVQENFEQYIQNVHAKRYVHNDIQDAPIINEPCDGGFTGTSLDSLKNNMIYAKLCYDKKPHQINESTPKGFVNNLHLSRQENISAIPTENDYTKVIRSHSDYLGCYKLFDGKDDTNNGKGKLNTGNLKMLKE